MRRLVFRPSRRLGRWSCRFGCTLASATLGCTSAESPTAPDPRPALEITTSSPLEFRHVTAGSAHSCGITSAGVAYCWGWVGAVGVDAETAAASCTQGLCTTPVPVAGQHVFRQLSASGGGHTCGVTTSDRLYCWGGNHTGQLGDGTYTDRRRPTRIAPALAFLQVSTGDLHTCAVTTAHVAYCWGHNQAGPLGTGTVNWSNTPVRVARRLAFREVSAGYQFTCGVTTDDRAFCWGLNADGQLGVGDDEGPELCFTGDGYQACATRPVRVTGGLSVSRLTTGNAHACAVTTADRALCWGANFTGQLGLGNTDGPELCSPISPCSTRPVRVSGGQAFGFVSAGAFHTCAVSTDRYAYCWGIDWSGELGTGSFTAPETCPVQEVPCSTRPVRVVGQRLYREVSAGNGPHSCGVTLAGRAFCWGDNSSGQLGDGTTTSRPGPRLVEGSGPA